MMLGLGVLPPAMAKPRQPVSAGDLPLIKAAMVYNICKFVEWPDDRLSGEAFVLGVAGEGETGADFASVANKSLHGRNLRVVPVRRAEDLAACHVLYVDESAVTDWLELSEAAEAHGILTVGDFSGFAASGGVVELIYDADRLRFAINVGAARSKRLTISSQVLKIALTVFDEE